MEGIIKPENGEYLDLETGKILTAEQVRKIQQERKFKKYKKLNIDRNIKIELLEGYEEFLE